MMRLSELSAPLFRQRSSSQDRDRFHRATDIPTFGFGTESADAAGEEEQQVGGEGAGAGGVRARNTLRSQRLLTMLPSRFGPGFVRRRHGFCSGDFEVLAEVDVRVVRGGHALPPDRSPVAVPLVEARSLKRERGDEHPVASSGAGGPRPRTPAAALRSGPPSAHPPGRRVRPTLAAMSHAQPLMPAARALSWLTV